MQIQECTITDVPKLAMLNKQLIDDEKSDNPMSIKEMDLEVLPWNESGHAFWKHCGFKETCIAMRYEE